MTRGSANVGATAGSTLALQALENYLNPSMDMIIRLIMTLNDSISFPYTFSLELNKLIDHSLNDSNSHFIILSLVVVIDNHQVLMDNQEYLLHVELIYELLKYLGEFKQALNDESWELGHAVIVLVLAQEIE